MWTARSESLEEDTGGRRWKIPADGGIERRMKAARAEGLEEDTGGRRYR